MRPSGDTLRVLHLVLRCVVRKSQGHVAHKRRRSGDERVEDVFRRLVVLLASLHVLLVRDVTVRLVRRIDFRDQLFRAPRSRPCGRPDGRGICALDVFFSILSVMAFLSLCGLAPHIIAEQSEGRLFVFTFCLMRRFRVLS